MAQKRLIAGLSWVRHAASVQSEPGSNSSLEDFENHQLNEWIQNGPTTAGHFGHSVFTPKALRRESPHKLPAEFLKSTRERFRLREKGREV
jgi:hypothetical protein